MRRAFRHLPENASIHGVRATVRIAQDDTGPGGGVEDRGPGIPEADRGRVFEPFARLDESRSRDTGGAGSGLAIARTIVSGHGGNISLENRGEGGSRATVMPPGGSRPGATQAVTVAGNAA